MDHRPLSEAILIAVRAVLPADMEADMKPSTEADVVARRLYARGFRPAGTLTDHLLGIAIARALSGSGIAFTASDASFAAVRSELERLTARAVANPYDRDHEAAVRAESAHFDARTRRLSTAAE